MKKLIAFLVIKALICYSYWQILYTSISHNSSAQGGEKNLIVDEPADHRSDQSVHSLWDETVEFREAPLRLPLSGMNRIELRGKTFQTIQGWRMFTESPETNWHRFSTSLWASGCPRRSVREFHSWEDQRAMSSWKSAPSRWCGSRTNSTPYFAVK